MAMNQRTMRPRASSVSYHAEALAWKTAAEANGGTVSTPTLAAVSTFCNAIDAAGIRDRFLRLNLFCGGNLAAARTPLYRGASLTGTQYGSAADVNNGPFVSGDYTETGASGGLKGNGTSKYLATGFATNTLSDGNRHISAYEVARSGATFVKFAGSETAASAGAQVFSLGYHGDASKVSFGFGAFGTSLNSSTTTTGGHWLGVNYSGGNGIIYKNGSQDTTGVTTASTPTSSEIFAFAINRANTSSAADLYGGRLGGYSIGLSLTSAEASSFYTAMQAFQTALGRNV